MDEETDWYIDDTVLTPITSSLQDYKQKIFENAVKEMETFRVGYLVIPIDNLDEYLEFMENWKNQHRDTDSPIYQGLSDSPAN